MFASSSYLIGLGKYKFIPQFLINFSSLFKSLPELPIISGDGYIEFLNSLSIFIVVSYPFIIGISMSMNINLYIFFYNILSCIFIIAVYPESAESYYFSSILSLVPKAKMLNLSSSTIRIVGSSLFS